MSERHLPFRFPSVQRGFRRKREVGRLGPFSVTYDSVITCPIDELKFYLIERNLTYKCRKSRKHSDIGPNFYTLNDFICIIESDISRDIPDFIMQDRIPFVDSMKYCLEFFDNKYIILTLIEIFLIVV